MDGAKRSPGGVRRRVEPPNQLAQGRFARAGVAHVGDPFDPEEVRMIAPQGFVNLRVGGLQGEFETVAQARRERGAVDEEET